MNYEEFETRFLTNNPIIIESLSSIACPNDDCDYCGFQDDDEEGTCLLLTRGKSAEKDHLPKFAEKYPEVLI